MLNKATVELRLLHLGLLYSTSLKHVFSYMEISNIIEKDPKNFKSSKKTKRKRLPCALCKPTHERGKDLRKKVVMLGVRGLQRNVQTF